MNLCNDCIYRKKELPCYHPIVTEELPDSYNAMQGSGYNLASAYGKIRQRLCLEFEPKSWNVCECKGHKTEG